MGRLAIAVVKMYSKFEINHCKDKTGPEIQKSHE